MNGPLTGRLHSVLHEEEHLSARGNGNQYLQVSAQQGCVIALIHLSSIDKG